VRDRAERADLILPRLHAALGQHSAVEWEAIMRGRVPCAVVGAIEDMFDHPQVIAEGLVAELGGYRGLASPFRAGPGARGAPARGAPELGEHTTEVLMQAHGNGEECTGR